MQENSQACTTLTSTFSSLFGIPFQQSVHARFLFLAYHFKLSCLLTAAVQHTQPIKIVWAFVPTHHAACTQLKSSVFTKIRNLTAPCDSLIKTEHLQADMTLCKCALIQNTNLSMTFLLLAGTTLEENINYNNCTCAAII